MARISLERVGAVCAVSYVVGLTVLMGLLGSGRLMDAAGAAEALPVLQQNRRVAGAAAGLLVVLPMLLAVSGVSFFHVLRQVGPLLWLPALAFVGGAFLIVYRGFIWLAVTFELAPAYVAAPQGTREALAAVGDTLELFAYMADLAGAVLIAGVGVLLFSVAIRHSSVVASKWLVGMGVFAAVFGGWFTLRVPLSQVFELISFVGTVAFMIWMLGMAVALWKASDASTR